MPDNSSLPTLRDLSRFGRVAPVSLFLGLLLFTIGATGELSTTNRKLMLGSVLICFSFVWHYFTSMVDNKLFDGQRTRYFVNWGSVLGFVVFAAAEWALFFALLRGRFPFKLLN